MSEECSEEIIVLKDRHIPVSKDHFLSILLNKFESNKNGESFARLASSMETLFYVHRIAKIELFKECYSVFSRLSELKHKLSFQELSIRQTKLMRMIYEILNDAHFNAITFEMYRNSIEKVFLSDLPIKVDFAKLDSNLLTQFYHKYPSLNPYQKLKHKPPFYQHFAMFYRGYGLNTMKGLFISQKLNLILSDLIPIIHSNISQFIAFITATLFTKKKQEKNDDDDDIKPINKTDITQHIDMLKLQRISLLDTYITAKSSGFSGICWWFLKNITIQEPTFKRLFMIYRQVPESFVAEQTRRLKQKATKIKSKLKQTAKKKLGIKQEDIQKEVGQGLIDEIGRKRKASLFDAPDVSSLISVSKTINDTYLHPIRIQYFSNVPMSDLEITYPAKQFSLKPLDQIYIIFTIFIGIWAVLKELFFSTDTTVGYVMVMASIFLMIRSIIWYRSTESEYVRVLNQALVESNISSDQDTILSLIDSVDEQQFMETILAYFVLLRNKDEVITDSDGVDRLCEKFMKDEFGEDINVMIDGAMNKLSELGLFKSGGMSKDDNIKVKGLLDALSCSHQHYQSAIQSIRKININHVIIDDDNDDDDEKKTDLVDDDDENTMNKTPPIITAKQISDDHFDKRDDGVVGDEFTSID